MSTLCICQHPLNDSQSLEMGGHRYKSCPRCSENAGRHVFHAVEHFGMRDMGDGRQIVQSWCPECRSNRGVAVEPAYRCG